MLTVKGSIINLVGPFFMSIYIRMPTINFSVTQSIEILAVNLSASEALVMNINNPLIGASYFGLETIPDNNGVYTSTAPKNTSGSFTLGTGVLGVVRDDYKMSAVVSPGNNVLTFSPAVAVTGSTLWTRGINSSMRYDSDAQAFFDRVTTAGGTLTTTEKDATNQLILDMKTIGVWSAMKVIYPMVGSSAAACAQNLRSSSFTGTFTSGWAFSSTGATPNGTSAYFNTGIICQTDLLGKNSSIGYYSRTISSGLFGDIGNFTVGGGGSLSFYANLSSTFYLDFPQEAVRATVANLNSTGFYVANNSPSTGRTLFRNASKIINTPFSDIDFPVAPNPNIAIGGAYLGSPGNERFSNRQIAFAHFATALTDADSNNLYTAVQTFKTTLGRQV